MKKCKACGRAYSPVRSLQVVCSPLCAIEFAKKAKARKEAVACREERKAIREAREKAKTRADHMREAQAAVNAYIRIRDANDPCISCDRPASWDGQWHASHYRSVGSNPSLRFNVFNINRACSICNNYLSGNIIEYRPRLIEKIGIERVELLERDHPAKKYDIEYLKRIKRIFNERTRRLRKMQDRGLRQNRHVSREETLPDALLPLHA